MCSAKPDILLKYWLAITCRGHIKHCDFLLSRHKSSNSLSILPVASLSWSTIYHSIISIWLLHILLTILFYFLQANHITWWFISECFFLFFYFFFVNLVAIYFHFVYFPESFTPAGQVKYVCQIGYKYLLKTMLRDVPILWFYLFSLSFLAT